MAALDSQARSTSWCFSSEAGVRGRRALLRVLARVLVDAAHAVFEPSRWNVPRATLGVDVVEVRADREFRGESLKPVFCIRIDRNLVDRRHAGDPLDRELLGIDSAGAGTRLLEVLRVKVSLRRLRIVG